MTTLLRPEFKPLSLPVPSLEMATVKGRFARVHNWEEMAKEAGYSAPGLARLCQVSLRHLQRHFHDCYGLKLRTWLNSLRLTLGYQMLLEGKSVKEVAYALSYKQLSHFSREFKKYHGVTPAALQTRQVQIPRVFTTFVPWHRIPQATSVPMQVRW